jgi:anaerobic magnesium-protoporphyrin IX monomethyl ester cyclase
VNVLFIYSVDDTQSVHKPLRSWLAIQLGISYISSTLRAAGHRTRLTVLGSNQRWQDNLRLVRASLKDFTPRLVCFTAVASQYAFIAKIASFIKEQWPEKYLLLGGVHAMLKPEEAVSGSFDALCVGEGEYPTAELCAQLEAAGPPHGIPNLWIKRQDGGVEKNPPREFLQDLDRLPFPDREMWSPWIRERVDDELGVLVGRGCPYDCTYCSNHAIKQITGGKYVRQRSVENIAEEISLLRKTWPGKQRIYLEVESIAVNKTWAIELCRRLEELNSSADVPVSYTTNFRIARQAMDEDLFIALRKAGFRRINIGLESGSERVRRTVLDRDYSDQDFLTAVSLARRQGLEVCVFNMIGLPGETLADHMETVALNRQCQPDAHFTGIFFPYPGTKLYDRCVAERLIDGPLDTRLERQEALLTLPGFSPAEIQNAFTWFDYRVYKGHKPLGLALLRVLAVKLHSKPFTNAIFRRVAQLPLIRHLGARFANR